ncbi:MAG TPA: hypothetical protein VF599_12620 [Pyrinomonadaceae bacterium]|jgi:hypothetical protein
MRIFALFTLALALMLEWLLIIAILIGILIDPKEGVKLSATDLFLLISLTIVTSGFLAIAEKK